MKISTFSTFKKKVFAEIIHGNMVDGSEGPSLYYESTCSG